MTVEAVLAGLVRIEYRVRALIVERRAIDPAPDDPFRGLYLSDEAVAAILDRPAMLVGSPEPELEELAPFAAAFGLDGLDVGLLLVALAPDVDSRFEQLYGYLNDDVTRRRASVELALALCGLPAADTVGRARLSPGSALVDGGLVVVEDTERPLLSRALRVPDRVVAHLLGDDRADADLVGVLREPSVATVGGAEPVAAALRQGMRLGYLRHSAAGSGRAMAAVALRAAARPVLDVDLSLHLADADSGALARALGREARLRGAGVVAGPVGTSSPAGLIRSLAGLGVPVLLHGTASWDPAWAAQAPLLVTVPDPTAEQRRALWAAQLDGQAAAGIDPVTETAGFRLGPEAIAQAAAAARAAAAGSAVTGTALRAGARAQSAAGLQRLARHIVPAVGWAQLVAPERTLGALHELVARARHRDRVLGEWGMRPGGGRGLGVSALFTGESGTGKTTAAEVIAGELGLDLYAVDLAAVVDKYVGETEKNLERIFSEAAGVNAVLLFDEADAIFGKRSAVSDAHDRYANIESAYLLQRMESFDGLAVLATNLRANLDDAFTRRLDMVVDFPLPDEKMRRALWDVCLGTTLPRDADLDLDRCAATFDLAGGDIRSAAVTAAYLAADADRPLTMADLLAAVDGEYRKLGRLAPEPFPAPHGNQP
ncbi:MAG: AAA family ATPase [Pseudonocardiaceae bacterium]|nr:AAA family ATPase [Pseudonocardiaceae bacterium]